MRFEDFKIGMELRLKEDKIGYSKGEIIWVEKTCKSDNTILTRNRKGEKEWFFEHEFHYFEPVQEILPEVQQAIDYIKKYFDSVSEYDAILRKHEKDPNSWDGNLRALNGLPIDQLRELLYGQSEIVQAMDSGTKSHGIMSSTQMEAFKGTKIRILHGTERGRVLPITYFKNNGRSFVVEGNYSFDASDVGKTWEFVDGNLNTDLSPEDYESMIDLALMTGDKEWFNELVTKSKYEGAIS